MLNEQIDLNLAQEKLQRFSVLLQANTGETATTVEFGYNAKEVADSLVVASDWTVKNVVAF